MTTSAPCLEGLAHISTATVLLPDSAAAAAVSTQLVAPTKSWWEGPPAGSDSDSSLLPAPCSVTGR